MFSAFCNVGFLAAWAGQITRRRTFTIDRDELWESAGAVLRLNLVVLYFFVVFHKLNTDYFTLDLSCGSMFWAEQRRAFPALPDGVFWRWFSIVSTVVIEALIPLLLFVARGRARLCGALLAVGFHGAIGFNPQSGYHNFSSMVYALVFVFVADDLIRALGRIHARLSTWTAALRDLPFSRQLALAGFCTAAGLVGLWIMDFGWPGPSRFLRLFWAAYLVPCLVVVVMAFGEVHEKRLPWRPERRWLLVVPLLLVFNGLCPHLGLKSETSFAMYSNLRTEGGRTNHFIYPTSMQIPDFQDDLIEVKQSSLDRLASPHWLHTRFELRRRLSARPQASITYVLGGRTVVLEHASDVPWLVEPPSLFERKFHRYRPVPKAGPERCMH